jgi:hypothetical protein
MARRNHYRCKNWDIGVVVVEALPINFMDERVNARCLEVKEKLIAFEYHNQEMTKAQIFKLCGEIINAMFDILEMTEE